MSRVALQLSSNLLSTRNMCRCHHAKNPHWTEAAPDWWSPACTHACWQEEVCWFVGQSSTQFNLQQSWIRWKDDREYWVDKDLVVNERSWHLSLSGGSLAKITHNKELRYLSNIQPRMISEYNSKTLRLHHSTGIYTVYRN